MGDGSSRDKKLGNATKTNVPYNSRLISLHMEEKMLRGTRDYEGSSLIGLFAFKEIEERKKSRGLIFEYRKSVLARPWETFSTQPYRRPGPGNSLPKDLLFVFMVAGVVVWESSWWAMKDTAKTALYSYAELPWVLDRAQGACDTYTNVTGGFREKAEHIDYRIKKLEKFMY